jgi:hypothetical protein
VKIKNGFALSITEFGKAQPAPVSKGDALANGLCAGRFQSRQPYTG